MSRSTSTDKRFITVEAAAKRHDVSGRTVRRWIADGRLMAYRLGPTLVRLDIDEVDALLRPIPTVATVGRSSQVRRRKPSSSTGEVA